MPGGFDGLKNAKKVVRDKLRENCQKSTTSVTSEKVRIDDHDIYWEYPMAQFISLR